MVLKLLIPRLHFAWPTAVCFVAGKTGQVTLNMAEIINLRRRRKADARKKQASLAAENRVRFGRTLAAKRSEKAVELKRERRLDGLRIESGDDT